MHKVVRNTLFTATALGLTSLGIGWNKDIVAQRQPLAAEQVALASQSQNDPSLPVSITVRDQVVVLGRSETLTIQTNPNATLSIVVRRPDGSVDPSHTFQAQADQLGTYVLSLVVSDYHFLGGFNVKVTSSSNGISNQASAQFLVVVSAEQAQQAGQIKFPFIP